MDLKTGYSIMRPIQLPWMFVSPSGLSGLDYHLSPDVFIRFEGIISNEKEFKIAHAILEIEKIEVSELEAEEIFESQYLPAKSKERVSKSLKNQQTSCFFTARQMEALSQFFEARKHMVLDVSVYYKDRKVDEIATLPNDEFHLVSKAFDELDVFWKDSHRQNKEAYETMRAEVYKEKTAELEIGQKKKLWDRVKNKGVRKRIATAVATVAGGIASLIIQRALVQRGGATALAGAFIFGTIGVFVELYGRNEANDTLRMLQFDGKERMGFNL